MKDLLSLPQWAITGIIVLFAILVLLSFGKFVIFCIGMLSGVALTLLVKNPLKHKLKFNKRRSEDA